MTVDMGKLIPESEGAIKYNHLHEMDKVFHYSYNYGFVEREKLPKGGLYIVFYLEYQRVIFA